MKFNKLIEDFNIFPKSQTALQSGPDIGMTTGDIDGTFPSRNGVVMGDLLPSKLELKLDKKIASKLIEALVAALKD